MGQNFQDFLHELSKQEKILCNDFVFKAKLKFSYDAYEYLKKAENLKNFAEVLASATAGGAVATIAWWSSASILTKFAIAVGLASVPVSWPVIGIVIGGGSYFGIKKLFNRIKKETVEEIPKFINAPIDLLALNLLDFLMPILAKMITADGYIHPKERKIVVDNLVSNWGYCREFVEIYLNKFLNDPELQDFEYKSVAKSIDEVTKEVKELNRKELIQAILHEVEEVIKADGKIDPKEMREYAKLTSALGMS